MEVIVQDANNIVIEVDQGRQGRGVQDVSLITVGADYYLLFTFTDGTTDQVGPIATTVTEVISAEVRNAESFTILKGQPVYLYQAQGNLATVKLAYNTSDATSAKTLGLAAENIAPNSQGLITCQGTLPGLNTSAYNEGDTLYLGATAGTLTNVKPQAPNHLVYIGVVERANAGAGQIYVRVQNGFELDEIHDVQINSPVNGNTLIYDASTSLWKNAGITAGSGISVTNGPASITVGNTGVLSFSGGTTGLTPATATTGAVTLAGTLSTANGGTGLSSFTANRVLYTSSTSAIGQSANLTFDGTTLTTNALTLTNNPTFNGGTANGVLYLNASKVATSGSGFTFASSVLTIDGGSGVTSRLRLGQSGIVNWDIQNTASTGVFDINNGAGSAFKSESVNAGVVGLYVATAGNVGVGTSSPGAKLHVNYGNTPAGSAEVLRLEVQGNAAGGRGPRIDFYGPAGVGASARQATIGGLNGYISFTDGSLNQILQTAYGNTNTPYLLIGASSRLDVLAGRAYLQIGDASTFVNATTATTIYSNWYPWNGAGNLIVKNGFYGDINFDQSAGNWIVSSSASSGLAGGTATSVERIRIDSSGNLLVGTTTNTNSSRLTVNGTISETVSSVQYLVASQFDVGTAPNKIPLNQYLGNLAYQNASAIAGQVGFSAGTAALPSIASATDLTTGRWFPAAGVMAWSTAGVERMRLDASGNLGLGITPSASNLPTIQSAFGILSGNSQANIAANAYYTTQWNYISTAVASLYTQTVGQHRWFNAPSGTAGNAISFTQAMTLTATGELGVGTTNPSGETIDVLAGVKSGQIVASTSTNNGFAAVVAAVRDGGENRRAGLYVDDSNATWGLASKYSTTGADFVLVNNNARAVTANLAGSVIIGSAAIATTATDGFFYIPTCAGAPTGTPTAQTGRAPLVVDSTNNRFYVYVNGSWKYAALV